MKKENRFILELCKGEFANTTRLSELLETHMDFPYILGHLLYNRIGAIAYYVLNKAQLLQKVNREFRNTLKVVYENDSIKATSFIKALTTMFSICCECEFPYAFLKGAYLVDIYPKGLRTSNDIDILIKPGNITEFANKLKKAGFIQGNIKNELIIPANRTEIISSRMNRGETIPFIKEVNLPNMKYLEIDVNFSLGFRPGLDENVVEKFLSNTQPLIINRIETLNKTDFLIHLCAHLYKEATTMHWVEMERDISLYKYCDIYLFLYKFMNEQFAKKFIERVCCIGLNKECYYALYYAKALFEIENKYLDKVLKDIEPIDKAFMNQVIEPQTSKAYSFDMSYTEWVFCNYRKDKLYETRNVK